MGFGLGFGVDDELDYEISSLRPKPKSLKDRLIQTSTGLNPTMIRRLMARKPQDTARKRP